MRTLLSHELRRTWREPLPWIVMAAAPVVWLAALLLGDERNPGGWQASALMQHSHLVALLPVLMTLLSVYLVREAQRDRRERMEEIYMGWPVASWEWALARTLALGSVTLAVWAMLAVLQAGYAFYSYASAAEAAGALLWDRLLRDTGIIAVDLLASCFGAQATAQVAAELLPGIKSVLALILYRIAALMGPGLLLGSLQWPHALLITPELAVWGVFSWQPYSEAFGLAPYEYLFFAHRLFWIGGSLALLGAMAFFHRNWRDWWAIRSAEWVSAWVALALVTAVPFLAHAQWQSQNSAAVAAAFGQESGQHSDVSRTPGAGLQPLSGEEGETTPVPVRYQIAADLSDAPEGRFQVAMEVELKKAAEALPLTLRRVFQVTSVSVEGEPVPLEAVQRAGDHLWIPLDEGRAAGDRVSLTLSYSGTVSDWRIRDVPEVSAIARKGMLVMPAIWGWYPVPGTFTLTGEGPLASGVYRAILDRERAFHGGIAQFDVTLVAPEGIRSVAGFQCEDGPGNRWRLDGEQNQVSLLGGDWWSLERDGITYLVPPEYLDTWETATADLHKMLTVMMDWAGPERLMVVPYGSGVANPEVLEAAFFGPIYQAVPDRASLEEKFAAWMLLRYPQPFEVRKYVFQRIQAEALGEEVDLLSSEPQGRMAELKSWAEATPIPEQKRQIRQLYRGLAAGPLSSPAPE